MLKLKVHPSQKKIIINLATGKRIEKMPTRARELQELFVKTEEEHPKEFLKSFSLVIHGTVDSDEEEKFSRTEVMSTIAILLKGMMESETEETVSQIVQLKELYEADIEQQYDRAKAEVKNEALKEIALAKKEFITIKVKVGNKNPKKINGSVIEQFKEILELAQERINIMLVGPAGCGKTYVSAQVASSLDLNYASQSCSAGMSESQLSGWLLPTEKGGQFSYVQSEFIRIYEGGGVFLFDEMDAADPNVLIFINQALSNGGFTLPQRFNNPFVKRHKDFVAIAATNTFGDGGDEVYTARNSLDGSTIDRFNMGMVLLGYSESVEEKIIDGEVLKWGRAIRKKIEEHGLRKIMSTRVMLDATKMKENQEWPMDKIKKSYFSNWSVEEKLSLGIGA